MEGQTMLKKIETLKILLPYIITVFYLFYFSFLLSRSANFLSLMKFAVEEAKSELNRTGKKRNVFVPPKKVCSEISALRFLSFTEGTAHQQLETCETIFDHILSHFLIVVSLAFYSDNFKSCLKLYTSFLYFSVVFSAQNIFSLLFIVATFCRVPYVHVPSPNM
jgi:hypothetical protein